MAPARDPSGCMLWIGAPCFHCKREDFLPLRCLACERLFCAEHFGQDAHACPQPARDVLVPLCPLCEEPPRGWRRDMPADELSTLMESHWTAPSLDRGGCRALVSQCGSSSRRCCVSRCQATVLVPVKPTLAPSKPQATTHTQIPPTPAPSRPSSSRSAIARRAAQERASTIRAMQDRNVRGLLSDSEKVLLAQLMAEAALDRHAPSFEAPSCTLM
ncbi:hypothetical protein MCAP1_000334 [Malassezia caprae]|uniref:AN1-type domain-containing protein n=1 Tax=Malassezia caprae TaxID=1381934 RepID=A0AAF0E8L9_9BASI|nr:hypothetical protein MCAP1_000334 [Malassezia caprae]